MVRAAREEQGFGRERLAELVGRSTEWVAKVENGEIASPPVGILRELARVLSLDEAELIVAAQHAKAEDEARRLAEALPAPVADRIGRLCRLIREAQPDETDLDYLEAVVRGWKEAAEARAAAVR